MFNPVRQMGPVSALIALVLGCASWESSDTSPLQLPRSRLSHDSVVLQFRFANLLDSQEEERTRLWSDVDEQHLDRHLRRNLEANGFRCGVVGMQLPEMLRNLLVLRNSSPNEHQFADPDAVSGMSLTSRRLHARARRPYPIVTSPTREKMVVLSYENGMSGGDTFYEAHCRFTLRAFPLGDSRVRLQLVPEIHHGPLRNRWIGSDGAILQDVSRDQRVYEDLKIDAILSPGETLAVTSSDQPKGLGQHFFVDGSEAGERHLMLLIRVAHTQWDDLFESEPASAPLATSER